MAEVAATAGVSMQTVSRFLRFPATVSSETGQAIQAAIDKTHYVHNLAASHLASARSNTVAAIIPTLSASVFAETIQHFSEFLHQAGYQIFLGNTDYSTAREDEVVRSLLGRRPDGLFIIGTRHSKVCTNLMKRSGIPIVEGWDLTPNPIDRLVGFSNSDAMMAMVRYLAQSGRRRIVFAGVLRKGDSRASQRRDGFVQAMKILAPHEAPCTVIARDGELGMAAGVTLLLECRRQFPQADAIVFSSDVLASGALLECGRRGIDVPGQLAITGFGDFELGRHLNPSLTTVAVPTAEIGRKAGRLLLDGMQGLPSDNKCIDVGFTLVVRQSS